jgi:hypothetical protein
VRRSLLVAASVLALGGVLLTGCSTGRGTPTRRYTYTGTVVAVCSQRTDDVPDCFAIRPDAGTAREDGYYAGGGAVSFGSPPAGAHVPRVGDHLTVTVATAVNQPSAVVQVVPAPVA